MAPRRGQTPAAPPPPPAPPPPSASLPPAESSSSQPLTSASQQLFDDAESSGFVASSQGEPSSLGGGFSQAFSTPSTVPAPLAASSPLPPVPPPSFVMTASQLDDLIERSHKRALDSLMASQVDSAPKRVCATPTAQLNTVSASGIEHPSAPVIDASGGALPPPPLARVEDSLSAAQATQGDLPFSPPDEVRIVLQRLPGLDAKEVTRIWKGTFEALNLCKLTPDLLRKVKGYDDKPLQITSTGAIIPKSQGGTLRNYTNPLAFLRFWSVYQFIVNILHGAAHPHLSAGLAAYSLRLLRWELSHLWEAVMQYHFAFHQALLDEGPAAYLDHTRWETMDLELNFALLGVSTLKASM
ncbi:hypothetical protein BJ508DRAFT_314966 [Ascobolus immersus RN42]|uniref:Uncharacterized protein n=1 Tax=Ascobolus immersus RN42 TaxID=1160509 RepID=A0A3N4HCY7_ASCIM|nr:hypothetical protein BJ508DRAFT_314966 [Ascobolus immersus RN42]